MLYDFICSRCEQIEEKKMKMNEYDNLKNTFYCKYCGGKMTRKMDFKGHFTLKGAGWFGEFGSGTGYEITQNEMDKNGEDNKRREDLL